MNRLALIIGSLYGMLGVAIGAFGAHGLKSLLEVNQRLNVFETAVKYQFYHAFALLIIGLIGEKIAKKWTRMAVYAISSGVLIFSGSLYILSITNLGFWGMITPIGGLLLIIGWFCLFLGIVRQSNFG